MVTRVVHAFKWFFYVTNRVTRAYSRDRAVKFTSSGFSGLSTKDSHKAYNNNTINYMCNYVYSQRSSYFSNL